MGKLIGPYDVKIGKNHKMYYLHEFCAIWCPQVYLDEASNSLVNIQKELRRALKFSCNLCGKKGAACGCF